MITVKKLTSGKLSMRMDYIAADQLAASIMSFLERESVEILKVRKHEDPSRWLKYYLLDELFRKHSGKMLGVGTEHNYVLQRSEAITLVWFLRHEDLSMNKVNPLLEIKNSLYNKIL